MSDDGRRDIYLPEGEWVNFFSGERLQGGRYHKDVETPLEEMPVFVRPEAEIQLYPEAVDCTDEMDLSRSISLTIDNDFHGVWSYIK
jgi:alpha-D-xyloside xylohydrolase